MIQDARQIYQDHLDTVSAAFWAGDFETVAAMMSYPHIMQSRTLRQIAQSPSELIAAAAIARKSMQSLGGTAYHRVCLEAEFKSGDADSVTGRHRVFLLRGGSYVISPYESRMCLGRIGGAWLGLGISNENDIAHFTTLDPSRAKRIAT